MLNKSGPARRGRKRRSDEAEATKKVRQIKLELDKKIKQRKVKEPNGVSKKEGNPRVRKSRARHSQTGSEDEDSDEKCAANSCLRPSGKLDWVQCDGGCEQWFHMACVGLSAQEINEDEDYICIMCSRNSSAYGSLQASPENPVNSPPSPDSTQPSSSSIV